MAGNFDSVPLWINGREQPSAKVFEVISPDTSTKCWTASSATIEQAVTAIEGCQAAFPSWAATKLALRQKILLKVADLMDERFKHLENIMSTEMGANENVAPLLVLLGINICRDVAGRVMTLQGASPVCGDEGRSAIVFKEPYGVTFGILPWNAPYVFGCRSIASAIATGNTTVLKGSEKSPRCFFELVKIFEEAGLPSGVINLIYTDSPESASVVEAIVRHPAVRKVNFTGSTQVGRAVARVCGANLKPCLMELGGKNSAIVLSDADLSVAAIQCILGAFLNSGQICMSTDRIMVMADIADKFEEAIKTAYESLATDQNLPKVISSASRTRLSDIISDALSHGAHIINNENAPETNGTAHSPSNGHAFSPMVVSNIRPPMRIWQEEAFGPVLGIRTVHSEQEAIDAANDTEYGLSMSIFTKDLRKALAIAKKLETGAIHINSMTVHDEPALPFGGVRNSGWGRFNAAEGMEEFLLTKTVTWDN